MTAADEGAARAGSACAAVEAKGLSKVFGSRRALDGVSLSLP